MALNIEIKARIRDTAHFLQIAEQIADSRDELQQEDIFFNPQKGRLKLRCFTDGSSELIYYVRSDQQGPKRSDYRITRTQDTETLKYSLCKAMGVLGIVRKKRIVFLTGQTRIHFDEVEGLGTFAELEVVMGERQTEAEGVAIAETLMRKLGIENEDLLDCAYIDMLLSRFCNPESTDICKNL